MFLFLVIALVVVVGAVTLAVLGAGEGGSLPDAPPDRLADPLPADRPLDRGDVETLRLPMAVRGYRMADVDDVLGRLGAELAERDARIADLEAALAGSRTGAPGGPGPLKHPGQTPTAPARSNGQYDASYDDRRYDQHDDRQYDSRRYDTSQDEPPPGPGPSGAGPSQEDGT